MGPHRIDARVALSIFDDTDTRIVPPDVVMTAPLDQLWPAAAAARPYYREVRTLGTHSINLFETYPEDFPRQIAQSDAIASVSPWLRLNRVRMISVDPPFGPGCVRFALPGFPAEVYCPGQRAGTTHSVRVYELIGHMDKEMPIPLAAEAIVRLGDRADPVLKFTLCVGAGYFATDAALEAGSVGSLSAGRVSSIVWEDSPLGRPLVVNTPSGLATGWIDLVPSRAAALSTRQYDQYLGNTVSFPVEVESISVRGQWGQERNSR